jgi:hypothetical protein
MAIHYLYEDPKSELCQGDLLWKSEGLIALIREYFPYYADHDDYKYFMIITQTCDLVRRDGVHCASPYITLAAVKPLRSALLMEAAKHQDNWQRETHIIGNKAKDKLIIFLESLFDNNKAGFFYLHPDETVQIHEPCCAFLQLSISFHSEHYDAILKSKVAQLKEPFQAKLGWLIGNMYSRVATTEWNSEKPSEPLSTQVSQTLKRTFVTIEEDRIREAIADLKRNGGLEGRSAQEIADYVKKKRLISRYNKFRDKAIEVLSGIKISEPLRPKVSYALNNDAVFKQAVLTVLTPPGEGAPDLPTEQKAEAIIRLVTERVSAALTDETLPGREKYLGALIRQLLDDATLKKLLS